MIKFEDFRFYCFLDRELGDRISSIRLDLEPRWWEAFVSDKSFGAPQLRGSKAVSRIQAACQLFFGSGRIVHAQDCQEFSDSISTVSHHSFCWPYLGQFFDVHILQQ